MKLNGTTHVQLIGRGLATINPTDHIATGGEASVYRLGDTVIKLYTNPGKLTEPGMLDKLQQLARLNHPYIAAPHNLVLDAQGSPIGYYMDFVEGGEPLSSVFTNSFRKRSGFGHEHASQLVDKMLQVLAFAHNQGAVMVDPNELNWTTVVQSSAGIARDPRALDVDSWLAGSHRPATIPMMASIRDWHANRVGPETDYFALGVVTFQVYTGIHPYKGVLEGYRNSDLEQRMRNNASVFTPGIRLNRSVRDFSCIPSALLGWYEAAFQQGERTQPPSPYTKASVRSTGVVINRFVTTTAGLLEYEKLFGTQNDPVVRVFPSGIVLTQSGQIFDLTSRRNIGITQEPGVCEVIKTDNDWLLAEGQGTPVFTFIDGASLQRSPVRLNLQTKKLVRWQNRLFAVVERGLTELQLKKFTQPLLVSGNLWQAMVNSTHWFDGVGVMDALGATYLIAPFGTDSCAQVRVRELDGLRIVAAKGGTRFIAIVAIDMQGSYRKIELAFDEYYTAYKVWQGNAETSDLNMALLPRGVVATIVRDGKLVIFVPATGATNPVNDKDISTSIALENWDNRVVFIRNGELWRVSLKR